MTDKIYKSLMDKMSEKYLNGMKEHGGGLEIKTDDMLVWLKELQNEMLDSAAYIEKMITILENEVKNNE